MNIKKFKKPNRQISVIQFGGGVFLRGFFDVMMQEENQITGNAAGDVMIVRSKTSGTDPLADQNFMYTHVARDGEHKVVTKVDCIAGSLNPADDFEAFLRLAGNPDTKTIVSNTTEAGIVYVFTPKPESAESYPARLAALIKRRFDAGLPGFLVLPCELIENNGTKLREIVLQHGRDWEFGEDFAAFVKYGCDFRNTLVDRIVSGKPSPDDELGLPWEDAHVNTSEYFRLWAIEGTPDPEHPLPFGDEHDFVKYVPALSVFRTMKVRILNGAHTSMIPYALLSGLETVGDCLADVKMRSFLDECIFGEILPSLEGECDMSEARGYAEDVIWRFANPFIHHKCASIALNSVSKWKVRVLPSILAYKEKRGAYPAGLVFSLAKLIEMYKKQPPADDAKLIESMKSRSVAEILADRSLWGMDLSELLPEVERGIGSEFSKIG